jgi:hypothetical protein
MVCNIENLLVSGLCPSSGNIKSWCFGSRSSFQNVVILDFRMMDKVQKPISSQLSRCCRKDGTWWMKSFLLWNYEGCRNTLSTVLSNTVRRIPFLILGSCELLSVCMRVLSNGWKITSLVLHTQWLTELWELFVSHSSSILGSRQWKGVFLPLIDQSFLKDTA